MRCNAGGVGPTPMQPVEAVPGPVCAQSLMDSSCGDRLRPGIFLFPPAKTLVSGAGAAPAREFHRHHVGPEWRSRHDFSTLLVDSLRFYG